MAVSNTNLLDLLGKQVSFSWLGADGSIYESDGQLTSVVIHLHGSPEFAVDDGEYLTFDKVYGFKLVQ